MGFFKMSEVKKRYDIGDTLGSGNFAVVKKSKKRFKDEPNIPEEVAIKIIDKAKVEDMNDITREIEIMSMIDHPNIIKCAARASGLRRAPAVHCALAPAPGCLRSTTSPRRCTW